MIEQYISNIENASTKLSFLTLVDIANALSIDCISLLGVIWAETQKEIKCEELDALFEKKLSLCIEICRLVASAG